MKLTKDQGHVKWFLWSHKSWNTWWDDPNKASPSKTNVCIYIRTSVVYPLIMGLSTLLTATAAYWALIGYPASTYGLFSYFSTIAIFVAFIYLAKLALCSKFLEKFAEKQFVRIEKCVEVKVSWWQMFWRWVVDKHNKICTLVEIVDND